MTFNPENCKAEITYTEAKRNNISTPRTIFSCVSCDAFVDWMDGSPEKNMEAVADLKMAVCRNMRKSEE